jgi:hypothetical protein
MGATFFRLLKRGNTMNTSDDTRPEPTQYTKNIEVSGQTCIVFLNVARSGLIRPQLQMPDLCLLQVGNYFFDTEDKAIAAATRTAQSFFATNSPDTEVSEEPAP